MINSRDIYRLSKDMQLDPDYLVTFVYSFVETIVCMVFGTF